MEWQALWDWLSDPKNQAILTWLGGGVVVVAGGLWAVVKFLIRPKKQQLPSVQVTADRGGIAAGRDTNVGNQDPRRKTKQQD